MDKKIKKVAIDATMEAGELLLKKFKTFSRKEMVLKTKRDLVTKADLESEKAIIKRIKKEFPDHAILAEESGKNKKKSDYLWIIDPLDGTTNFSMHNPLWGVSIAVAYKNKVVFAVVNAPYLHEMYIAEEGQGAQMNSQDIMVSKIKPEKVLNTYCHGSKDKDIKRAVKYYVRQKMNGFDCRQLGAASLELAFVAAGRIESIAIPGANSWDVAAGILIVREAGGEVTDFKGKDWNLETGDMVASNGRVHDDLVNILKNI
ncbi:inositol monophosphatase [Candidatus Falkowbacteria bacterium]|nr:inositol monophosphatase [Candidatus Falkowbacteria bacterium]